MNTGLAVKSVFAILARCARLQTRGQVRSPLRGCDRLYADSQANGGAIPNNSKQKNSDNSSEENYLTSRTRDSIQTGLAVLAIFAVLASSAGRSSHSRFPHRAFFAGFAVLAGLSSNSCAASQRYRPPTNNAKQ